MKKIFISSDHAGFKLKETIKDYLRNKKVKFEDLGPKDDSSVDYPDYAHKVARKVKLIDLAYKWEDPPTAMRSTPLIKIEKQPIYFAIRKVISPRFYKNKIKSKSITKDQAIEQISEILDIAIMIRYQDTESLESMLRGIDNGDNVIDIFKNKIELIYF